MGPTQINGLPAHVLLVHVVVVFVPLTALLLVGSAIWPGWLRRLGIALPLLALISVPLTTHAGEWLERHTASTPQIRHHAELGDGLLPWAAGLFVLALALWEWQRRTTRGARSASGAETSSAGASGTDASGTGTSGTDASGTGASGTAASGTGPRSLPGSPLRIAAVALCAVVAAGSLVQVYRIGDSGAKAAWTGNFSSHSTPDQHG
jgi:hypothetical protein